MKKIILPILILFIIFGSACYTSHKKEKTVTFITPFGEIEKEASMGEIMSILGNPHHIVSGGSKETWYYFFGENNDLEVYFVNGRVLDIKQKSAGVE